MCRSGYVGAGKEDISGSMNLHKLPRIGYDAVAGKDVRKEESKGTNPFFPMLLELPDDVLDIVFVNQVISFHDRGRGIPTFDTEKDLLLILKGDLGIRNQEGRKEGMGCPTLFAPYPLNIKE